LYNVQKPGTVSYDAEIKTSRFVSAAAMEVTVWKCPNVMKQPDIHLPGHDAAITCAALQGKRILTGSADCIVRIWRMDDEFSALGAMAANPRVSLEKVLEGAHHAEITAIVTQADCIVTAGEDSSVHIWDGASGAHKMILRGHACSVTCIAISGNTVVSGDAQGMMKIWDISEWCKTIAGSPGPLYGVCTATLAGHTAEIFSVALSEEYVVSGCALKFVLRLLDIAFSP
jgi:WD40 repeat protein